MTILRRVFAAVFSVRMVLAGTVIILSLGGVNVAVDPPLAARGSAPSYGTPVKRCPNGSLPLTRWESGAFLCGGRIPELIDADGKRTHVYDDSPLWQCDKMGNFTCAKPVKVWQL